MADVSITSLGRGQCCMLCCSQLFSSPGLNIYQARTYHGEKSFYTKLMELTNCTSTVPQLPSDSLCSMCATLVSQVDQLEFQLSHVIGQIRALFHKMLQAQGQAQARQQAQARAPPQPPPGLPGGGTRAASTEAPPSQERFLAQVKTEPGEEPSFFAKKPAKENGSVPVSAAAARRPAWTPGLPVHPSSAPPPATPQPGSQADDAGFNISAFLQTSIRSNSSSAAPVSSAVAPPVSAVAASSAPAVSSAPTAPPPPPVVVPITANPGSNGGDFTEKFVRTLPGEDTYRHQCVLCGKLGDSQDVIRQHVRVDHPGADRITFPGAGAAAGWSAAGKRPKPNSAAATKGPKAPRSITASSPAMAQKIAERAYVCAGCDKAFGCEAFLTRHVTSQHCGRMFSCQFCGKEFSRSDKKVRHERSHTGERPFVCNVCGKAFARKDKCTNHERSHVKPQPIDCPRCGETLGSMAAYATHQQSCSDDVQGTGSLWQSQTEPMVLALAPPANPE